MEAIHNPAMRQQVFDNVRATIGGRREGIHLSDTIFCLRKAYFRKVGLAPSPTDELCLLWLTGYAFQAYMFPKDEEITILVDGINCTPDIPSGIEVKSTRMSMGKFDPYSQLNWHKQILGYCKALNKLEYDLVVMFVCGDYKPPFPNLDCWHIIATQEEVDTNWAEVIKNADDLAYALVTQEPPAPTCEPWESKYCECIDFCPDTECYRREKLLKGTGKKK